MNSGLQVAGNPIEKLFQDLRAKKQQIIIPFLTAGDPDLATTSQLIAEFARRGCPLVEIGIPYSDPIADGPVIQASYCRALGRKIRVDQILEMLHSSRAAHQAITVTMVSYAIMHRIGLEAYVEKSLAAGVAGAIVPDLLVDEAAKLAEICRRRNFSLIQLVTPTTPRDRAIRIAETSTGFLYYVSVTGITGERRDLPAELVENVAWLRQRTSLPVCVGFGISTPEHVKLIAPVADGLIVGSAIVRQLENCLPGATADQVARIGDYVSSLIAALPSPR